VISLFLSFNRDRIGFHKKETDLLFFYSCKIMIVNICDGCTYISLKDVITANISIINVNKIRIKRTIMIFVEQSLVRVYPNNKNRNNKTKLS